MPKVKKVKLKKKKLKIKVPQKEPKEEFAKPEEGKAEEEERKEIEEEPAKKEEGEEEKKELVRLSYKALDKILRHGMRFSNPSIPREKWVECMGFLVGNVDDDKVEIKDAIPIVHGNLVEVEFQDEHYAKADEINQSLTDENWVVGWYHTHPGHGLFLSAVDKINHSGYQSLNSKAIALVFDPSKIEDKSRLEEYIKIFKLKDPELRERSDFMEIEGVEVVHSLQEVIASVYETSMLFSKNHPLVLEYGEEIKKLEPELAEEPLDVESTIKEMRGIIKKMHKEIKILHNRLQGHMESTKKAIEELKEKEIKESKVLARCEFCGYESITPGDKICGNCGKSLI